MSHLVFVFGTLKEEFPNFGENSGTRVPGTYETVNQYPLYLVGERHSPWMVNAPGSGEHVIGQVFCVDSNSLARMDILERVSEPDGYERILIKVRTRCGNPSDEDDVYAYLKHPRHLHGADIKDGPFAEYSLAHSALYRSRGRQT
ncbi:gamma-glutamylcyclotransferase [Rhodoferax sp. U2-2l]|uniref:gamma-glutamylcyclotransferase family protein n=1 Tax=Rhodoferax sp. U2-2l TaxID=2884000 RepID=UPI001D0AE186|nr:gamma-glutamylcyclotransferase [Rhodoferax sp. U2-2l]